MSEAPRDLGTVTPLLTHRSEPTAGQREYVGRASEGASTAHTENVGNVLRLRIVIWAGLVVWTTFVFVDWVVCTYDNAGDFELFLSLRLVGIALLAFSIWRLHRLPVPSQAVFSAIVFATWTGGTILISMMCLEYRGFFSPYAPGIVLVIMCRAVAVVEPWRSAAINMLAVTMVYPAVMFAGMVFMPELREQITTESGFSHFLLNLSYILSAYGFTVVGTHSMWSLQRKVYEARAIGRYRLKHHIGSGGMGEVWLAHHHVMKRDIAIKLMQPKNEAQLARFEREFLATAMLSHPNTVRVLDYGATEDGLWYYAMEFLEGETVAKRVSRDGRLPVEQAVQFAEQAARSLAEAHQHNIVHRDIKPQNLFITRISGERDFIKVIDFGIAAVALSPDERRLTQTGAMLGTPYYAAPELILVQDIGPPADVYSLGCTLYYMLTAHLPFSSDDPQALYRAHLFEHPITPATIHRDIPLDIEQLVLKCLAKRPKERYADGAELAQALRAL